MGSFSCVEGSEKACYYIGIGLGDYSKFVVLSKISLCSSMA